MDEIYLGNWSPAKNPGEPATLDEIYSTSLEKQRAISNQGALWRNAEDEHDARNAAIKSAIGVELPNPFRQIATQEEAPGIVEWTKQNGLDRIEGLLSSVKNNGNRAATAAYYMSRYEQQLRDLQDKHPEHAAVISAEQSPWLSVLKRAQKAEEAEADAGRRRGFVSSTIPGSSLITGPINMVMDPAGTAASMLGGLRGSLESPADIAGNLLGFAMGGPRQSLIKNMLYNAVSNAAVQTMLEPGVQLQRKAAGLEYGVGAALENIAGAAGVGAALDVAVRAPVRAVRKARGATDLGGVFTDAAPDLPEPPRPAPVIDPEIMKAAEAGDILALRKLAEQTRAIEDPSVKAMVEHLELTGSLDEAVKRFKDEMQSRTGTAIDDGDLQKTVAGHLRAAIDPDVLPPRREPAAVKPAAEPLMDAEAARIITDHAPQVSEIVAGLEPRIAALVSEGLEAGLGPIVRAVQHAIDAGPEGKPQTIAKLGNAVSKEAADMGGMDKLADHVTLHSGRASVMEVATAMRRSPEMVDSNVSFGTEMMQVARALATLDDGAFNILARGEADPRIGQMVADTVEPGRQAGVLDQVARAGVRDLDEARRLIADLEPRRIPEPVRDGVDDPNSAETKAATERMEQSMAPEVEMARKAVPEPQPGQSMVDAIMQSAVVRRGAETREAIVDAIRLASKILPEGTRLDIENAEMRDPRTGGLLDAQTASNGDIILAAYAMNPAGRIGHEGVHALVARGLLSPDEVKLLADAAGKTEIKADGAKEGDAPQTVFPADRRAQYAEAYADRPNLDQLLDEEAAAHLIEAVVNKKAIPEDAPRTIIERIQKMLEVIAERLKNWRDGKGWQTAEDLINDILNGEVAKREGVKAWMRGEDISAMAVKPEKAAPAQDMFALSDRETGQSMRRDLDSLGYYSQALEAARSLKQAKGTPEQMLAQLKSAGVKDAEIEATGLRSFLDGKKAVTRDDIVGHLEGNRVGLSEVQRAPQLSPEQRRLRDEARSRLAQMDSVQAEAYRRVLEEQRRLHGANSNLYDFSGLRDVQQQISAEYARMSQQRVDNIHPPVKWSAHSLNPSNPTYRETVLHLPDLGTKNNSIVVGPGPNGNGYVWGVVDRNTNNISAYTETVHRTAEAARAEAQNMQNWLKQQQRQTVFSSGHFPEPNIVGHMMTSMTKHQGKPVFTLDQIQSDWGQKLRDGGVRDEAKIAELRKQIADLQPAKDAAFMEAKQRIEAELRTAEASSSGHPLVNTTDQWVNTTLRRALRQAAEAGADYIAIPHGDTVLSYNPGDEGGMRGFYGSRSSEGIVPKNLRKLLEKLDKDSARPVKVDNLETPSGTRGYRPNAQDKFDKAETGFTLFPLTDKVKAEVTQRGQAMFAFAGEPPEAIARAAAERFGLPDGRPHDVLVALGDLIDRDRGLVKNVRASVKAERDEARQFIDLISKAMSAPKEDQGIVDGYTAKIAERYSGDDGTERSYVNLYRDGKMIADATVIVDQAAPNTMVIEWIETLDGTRLSVSDIRAMRESIRAEFPNVKKFSGFRVSGAKEEQFAETDPRRNQTVVMFAFAGEKARTADLDALSRAQQMEADGVDRDTIWRDTGWGKFPDGRWRFELDDSKSAVYPSSLEMDGKTEHAKPFRDVMTHAPLLKAYPDFAKLNIQRVSGNQFPARKGKGEFSASRWGMAIDAASADRGLSIALHEIQHGVQTTEGFAKGTNPIGAALAMTDDEYANASRIINIQKQADYEKALAEHSKQAAAAEASDAARQDRTENLKRLREERNAVARDPASKDKKGNLKPEAKARIDALDKEYDTLWKAKIETVVHPGEPPQPPEMGKPDPYDIYRMHAGEVESRTVQKRMNMTADERRARAPWHDFDVPEDQQIVRFANGTGLSMFAFSQEAPVDGFSMRGLRMYAIRAYHGSPHDFDKFDLSKIGTGEGAQAYGHGLYFAENEGVAKSYKDKLSGVGGNSNKWQFLDYKKINDLKRDQKMLDEELRLESGYADMLRREIAETPYEDTRRLRQRNLDQSLGKIAELQSIKDGGRLYEVRINADPSDFLDWDKPLSQQSEKVRERLKGSEAYKAGRGTSEDFLRRLESGDSIFPPTPERLAEARRGVDEYDNRLAGDFVRDLPFGKGSEQLREAGIPGIRYLDQGSRTAGDGSRNYVVFDDNIIEIVAKDGVPVTKQERAEIIGRMQPEQKAEPQSPFPSDLQTADRLKDAGEAINVKPDDGAMYALADPKSVIDELERKSTIGKSEADEIRKKLDHLKAAGMSDDAALDAVAAELEGISEDKKRVALLGEKARQTLIGDLVKYRNHRGETDVLEAWKRLHERFDTTGAYIEDLETARLAIQERTLARMGGLLKEFKRGALTGDMRRKTGRTYAKQQNMVRELFGESTGDQTAKELATAVGAMFEDLRLRFNKAGGHIGKLEKWGMPQGHDAQALRDYGMQKWVDYMMQDGVLDRDRMVSQHTGRKLTDGELRDALTVTWQRITTDGWVDREITGQPMGRGALFNQHSDHRFLHFKTADAWLRYAKDFGNPDPYAAIMNHVARMSRDIAHMERLGPNPQMMRTYIRNWMTQKAASAGSVESLIREQQGKMAQLAKDHAEELKDLLKGRQELLDELAERYLDMERVKMRSAIKRGLGMKEEQAKRLADLDARTRVIDNLLYNRTQQRDLLTMRHAMVREQIADMMRAMREAVEISSDKDPQAALNNTLNRVDAMWEVQRGALVPVSTKMANVLAIGRNIISADALGSAVISSITDPAYGQEARKRWGESFARSNAGTVMAQTLKQMFKPGARWEALDSGIAMDSAMSVFHSQAKQNKSWLPWMRDMSGYINDRVLSLGLLTPWTEAGKAAHGTWLQLYLGRNAHLPFDKLAPDIQKGLTANGFDAASWEQIRMSRLYDPKTHGPATRDSQAKQLRPKEIEAAAGQDLAERYIAMIARETRHGIIETTVESRAAIIGTTRPGTVSGEIVRSAGQFKGFPLAVVFIVLGRLAREIGAGDYKSAARHAASLAITSAFLGFAAMALKDIKDGRDPRRLLDEKTWMAFDTWAAAILQAGGLGIWGDFLFSNVNRQGNGLAATLGGPMVDRIDNIKNLTIGNLFQIYQGKDTQVGREGVRFLRQNVPGVSSWFFTSMAWNRIFMDEMQRMVDPKAHEQFRAQIMNRRRDYGGQEYWWKPGQTRPERAPDLTRPFATQ